LKEWAVPSAWVDFRLGGTWETSYDPKAQKGNPDNIKTRILSYQPMEMISLQAVHAPPGFEHPELLEHLFSVFTFAAVDEGRTRIRAAGIGYARGEAFDEIYDFFRTGNAWTLAQLQERFKSGPVNWRQRLREMPGHDTTQETQGPSKHQVVEHTAYEPSLLIQVAVADLDRAIRFYTEILGLQLESRSEELQWARIKMGIPGVTIGLGRQDTVNGSGTVSLNLGVRDLDLTRRHLEKRGVHFTGPTIEVPGVVRLADLEDPDGNKIRLAEDIQD
jgi:predicted enzyme related to lactoylglutathione lyase